MVIMCILALYWAVVKKENNFAMQYIFKNVCPNFIYLLNEAAMKWRESNYQKLGFDVGFHQIQLQVFVLLSMAI
jgi:hypothetical protein